MRCAIYTRKSSDEGLDQSFNSLDAQHEACASYIASQRHEGWKLVKKRYDDGGISGGTLERPALKRLLEDIDASRIQMVVVYKIDRLTRSLADFAKLVERLEAAGCSFVSVTQAFNTSSSMGRLTLNVLLSFAQFEREVTAERIRDKIAASKQKGLWMGGICPLGYDRHPDPQLRTLVINDREAKTVRIMFDLYDQHGCLRVVEREGGELGLKSKRHTFATGRTSGGRPFSRGQIYYILRNPLYIGDIRHKDKTYPGQHPAIIDPDLWGRVQEKLQRSSQKKRGHNTGSKSKPFLLTGKLWDETGDRLTPTSTDKGSKKHRYYASNRLITGGKDPTGWRISAEVLEQKVTDIIADHLDRQVQRAHLFVGISLSEAEGVSVRVMKLTQAIRSKERTELSHLVAGVRLMPNQVGVELNTDRLAASIGCKKEMINKEACVSIFPWQIKKRGVERKIVVGDEAQSPDLTLIKALAQAHRWLDQIREGKSLKAIADEAKVTPAYIRARSHLALLSPKIQEAIISGKIDPTFTTNHIMGLKIPMDWAKQDSLFLLS